MTETVVEIKGLYKKYDTLVAVNHMDLEVKEGEVFGLLGPNGSGKSTTINCILGLIKYQEGAIKVFGKTMQEAEKEIKRNIGVIMQDVAVFDELTVYENVSYFCSLYIEDKVKLKQYTEEAIEFVALEEFRKFYPKKLSGGLLRRLNIACGIAHKPKLIILDEPTVSVDPQSRNKILEGITALNKQGATIIYTTHYMEEVEQICNNIAIIDKGKVVARGTKEELKDSIGNSEKICLETAVIQESFIAKLKTAKEFLSVQYSDNKLDVTISKGSNSLVHLLQILKEYKIEVKKVNYAVPTLNDVFLEITGKELRD